MATLDLRHKPPLMPREWVVHVRIPAGVALSDHALHDRAAAEAAPPGWYCVGTIPISPRDRVRLDDPKAWHLRVTYWPEAWRETTTLLAPPAAYAAAQIAGLRTRLDGALVADHHGIQYVTPDGRPLARECFWDGRDSLPAEVLAALSEIERIDRRRTVGYMWARPDTGRAWLVATGDAESDDTERAKACATVREWVRASHPEALSEAS